MGEVSKSFIVCIIDISDEKFELLTSTINLANTLTVQLISRTRQRSGLLSQPGFESRHKFLKMKIKGTSLPLVEFF